MFNLSAALPTVVVDAASGRPRQIRMAGERLAVTALRSVRDETAAYALETGPRTVFVVEASGRRYRLVHLLRERRWSVEELGSDRSSLARVA